MMHASRASLVLLASSALAVVGAVAMLLVPAVSASDARTAECGRLLSQVERRDAIALERDRLRAEVIAAKASADRVLRSIPESAEQAHLMRMLAVGTGPDMGTQTIVAGDVLPATPAERCGFRAVPVTVEMKASFERVMEVLARAEGDRRLVRPIHIEIQRPAQGSTARGAAAQPEDSHLVEARIELDAVFGTAVAEAGEEQP